MRRFWRLALRCGNCFWQKEGRGGAPSFLVWGYNIFGPCGWPPQQNLGGLPPWLLFFGGPPLLDARHQGPLLFSNGGLAGLLLGLAI